MFKNILKLLLILILFSFSSCWEDSGTNDKEAKETEQTEQKNNSKLRNYPWKDFSMGIPKTWNNITKEKDIITKPRNWKIELAVTSTQTKWGFSNTLIILSQTLEKYTTSKRYSITNSVWAKNDYLNYYEIENKNFNFNDWEKSKLYIFKAKYNTQTSVFKFIQTAYVCNNNKAFFITIALSTSIEDTKRYEDMIKTFKCK